MCKVERDNWIFQVSKPDPKKRSLFPLQDVEFYQKHMQCRSSCLGVMTSGGTAANIQAQEFLLGEKNIEKSWKNHGKSWQFPLWFFRKPQLFPPFFSEKIDGYLKLSVRGLPFRTGHRLWTINWCQALWMARHRAFPDAEKRGLSDAGGAVVLTSVLAHYSMEKASSFVCKKSRWFMEILDTKHDALVKRWKILQKTFQLWPFLLSRYPCIPY